MAISAVITADIVNSTLLTPASEKKLVEALSSVLNPNRYEFYRGDSFQVYIKDPGSALRILLQTRVIARKISPDNDIRASIGIGEVNPHLRKLNTATDEAFVLSGRSFDVLSKTSDRLMIQSPNDIFNHAFKVISYFIDYLFKNLTEKQAEVFFVLLENTTQAEVAKKLKKSQSTVNKHIQSGGWHELSNVLTEYRALVSKF
jgi:hypothetical protein